MKLGLIRRISKEDMARHGDIPKWVDPMLDTLNEFIEKITTALNGNLTFADNFLCKEYSQDFQSGTAYTVNPQIDGRTQLRPYGVLVVDTNGATIDKVLWTKLATGSISVTLTFSAATTNKCTILILLR